MAAWYIALLSPAAGIEAILSIEHASVTNPWTRPVYHPRLENPGVSFCFLARDEAGLIVGFCSVWRVLDELHINNLAVLPEFRRAGVATALLGRALAHASESGAQRATLEVRRSNDAARLLYEQFGFTVAGIRR